MYSIKQNFLNIFRTPKLSYSAWAGQILLSQVNFGQDKDGPPPLRVHLANQVCYDAPLCIHTAVWKKIIKKKKKRSGWMCM